MAALRSGDPFALARLPPSALRHLPAEQKAFLRHVRPGMLVARGAVEGDTRSAAVAAVPVPLRDAACILDGAGGSGRKLWLGPDWDAFVSSARQGGSAPPFVYHRADPAIRSLLPPASGPGAARGDQLPLPPLPRATAEALGILPPSTGERLAASAHPLAALAPDVFVPRAATEEATLRALAVARRAALLHGHRATVSTAMKRASGTRSAHQTVSDPDSARTLACVPTDLSPRNARLLHRTSLSPSGFPEEFDSVCPTPVPWAREADGSAAAGGMGVGFGLGGGVGAGNVRAAWEPSTDEAPALCSVKIRPASSSGDAVASANGAGGLGQGIGAPAGAAAAAASVAGAAGVASSQRQSSSASLRGQSFSSLTSNLELPLSDDDVVPISLFEHMQEHPLALPLPGMGLLAVTITRLKADGDGSGKKNKQQAAATRGSRRARRGKRARLMGTSRTGRDASALRRTWGEGVFEALPEALDDPESDDDVPGVAENGLPGGPDVAHGRKRGREHDHSRRTAQPGAGTEVGQLVTLGPRDRSPLFGDVREGEAVTAITTTLGISPAHPHPAPPGLLVVSVRRVHTRTAEGVEDSVWVGRVTAPVRVWAVGQLQPSAPVLSPFERSSRTVAVSLMQLQLLREMIRRASRADDIAKRVAMNTERRRNASIAFCSSSQRLEVARAVTRMTQQDGYAIFPWSASKGILNEVFSAVATQLAEGEDGRRLVAGLVDAATSAAEALGVASVSDLRGAHVPPRWAPLPYPRAQQLEASILKSLGPADSALLLAMRGGEQALMDIGVTVMQSPTDADTRLRRVVSLAERLEQLAAGKPVAEDVREERLVTGLKAHVSQWEQSAGAGAAAASAAGGMPGAGRQAGDITKPQSLPSVVLWAPPDQRPRLSLLAAEVRRLAKACEAVAAVLFNSPWAQSQDFVSIVHNGKPGQLTLLADSVRGRTDPSGCGAMLSFTKEPTTQRNGNASGRASRSRRAGGVPGVDYRKFRVEQLNAMLRSHGMRDEYIASLPRWAKTRDIKKLQADLAHGEAVLGDGTDALMLPTARLEMATPQQRQSQKRLQAASIMDKQRRWLAKGARRHRRTALLGSAGAAGSGQAAAGGAAARQAAADAGASSDSDLSLDDDDDSDDDDSDGGGVGAADEGDDDDDGVGDGEGGDGLLESVVAAPVVPRVGMGASAENSTRETEAALMKHSLAQVTGAPGMDSIMRKRAEARDLDRMRASKGLTGSISDEPTWLVMARRWGVTVKLLGGSRKELALAERKLQAAELAHRTAIENGMAGDMARAAISVARDSVRKARQGATIALPEAEATARGVPPQLRAQPATPLLQLRRGCVKPHLTAPELTAWLRDAKDEEVRSAAGAPPANALVRRVTREIQPSGKEVARVVFSRDRLAVERTWLTERFGVDLRSIGRKRGQPRRGGTDREAPERLLERDRLRRLLRGGKECLLAQWGFKTWALAEAAAQDGSRTVMVLGEEFPICEQCGMWGHSKVAQLCPRAKVKGSGRRGDGGASAASAGGRSAVSGIDARRGGARAAAAAIAAGDDDDYEEDFGVDDERRDDALARVHTRRGRQQGQMVMKQMRKAGLLVPSWRNWWQGQRPEKRTLNMALERVTMDSTTMVTEQAPGFSYNPDEKGFSILGVRYNAASMRYEKKERFKADVRRVQHDLVASRRGTVGKGLVKQVESLLAQQRVEDVA